MRKLLVVLGIVLVFTACGRDPVSYRDAQELQDAVRAAGWDCDDQPLVPNPGEEAVYEDALTCTLEEAGFAQFVIFEDDEQRRAWRSYVSLTPAVTVEGPNWAVTLLDVDVAEDVADALGGEVDE